MYDWLRKILRHAETRSIPTTLSDDYWIFDTSYDEEISSKKLLEERNRLVPGSEQLSFRTQTAVLEAVAAERATLQAKTTLEAEKIRDGLGNVEGHLSLSVLIDHSGSMRDDKVQMALVIAGCASQLASKLDIPFEVLGFTTVEWKGDPVRGLWISRGQPEAPGRLCALRHIVYSDFKTKRLPDLRAMFLPDILKENVDGEAILWAAERARKIDAARHLVVVVSDGAPVDDSTLAQNRPDFLWDHLLSVMAEMKADDSFTVVGVGLDHDVRRIYKRSTKLVFFGDVEKLFLPFLIEEITDAIVN